MTTEEYNCAFCEKEPPEKPNKVDSPGKCCEDESCQQRKLSWIVKDLVARLGPPVSYPREVGPCPSMTFDVESIPVSVAQQKKFVNEVLGLMAERIEVSRVESDPDVMPLGHYHWPRWATFDPKPLVAPDPLSGPSSGYEGSEQPVVQSLPEGEQDQPFDFTPDQPDKQFRLGHRPADEPPDKSGDA